VAVVGKYIFNGTMGTSEVFAYGWAFRSDTWTSAAQAVGAGAVWIARMLTVNGIRNVFAPNIVHTSVRAVCYNADGSTQSAVTLAITPITGGSTSDTNTLPFEVAPCVTLRTALATARGRGRFYLPPPVRSQISGDGIFSSTLVAGGTSGGPGAIAEAMSNFKANNPAFPVVISKAGGTISTSDVTTVEIGNIPDAQRRRRNRQVETRTSATVT